MRVGEIHAHVLWVRPGVAPDARTSGHDVPRGFAATSRIGAVLQIFVKDNNIDQALKALKRRMQREGVFREMKRRRAYEKPSERRIREQAEAIRRSRKAARKKAINEGLIAAPKKIVKKPGSSSSPR
jgi:small subunit ribosomal protein S21